MARIRLAAPIAIVLALAMTPALAGCFGNPVETIIEGATGGEVDLGGTSIPDGFPAEVPVIDGEIVYGAGIGSGADKIYNVTVKVTDGSVLQQIKTDLEAAGFASQGDVTDEAGGGTFIGSNDTLAVLVVVSNDGTNGWVANYTVTPAGAP